MDDESVAAPIGGFVEWFGEGKRFRSIGSDPIVGFGVLIEDFSDLKFDGLGEMMTAKGRPYDISESVFVKNSAASITIRFLRINSD